MPLNTLSLERPLTSYAKLQRLVGSAIRNRLFQLRRPRVRTAKYLYLGCGLNTHEDFINLDYLWHPRVDVCWDVRRGLPFATGSLRPYFSEHFPFTAAMDLLREIRRGLASQGIARIIVPNGELYLHTYAQHRSDGNQTRFPF